LVNLMDAMTLFEEVDDFANTILFLNIYEALELRS